MNKLLVIDDDLDLLEIVEKWFNEEGFEIKSVSNPTDVFKILEEYVPDLILIDYLLTDLNGGEICSKIKSSFNFSHIPIVIISGYPKVFLSLGNYKCDLFIAKPFDLRALTEQMHELIRLNQLDPHY